MEAYLKELTESEAAEIDTKYSSVAQVCRTSVGILCAHRLDNVEENISILRRYILSRVSFDRYGMGRQAARMILESKQKNLWTRISGITV